MITFYNDSSISNDCTEYHVKVFGYICNGEYQPKPIATKTYVFSDQFTMEQLLVNATINFTEFWHEVHTEKLDIRRIEIERVNYD